MARKGGRQNAAQANAGTALWPLHGALSPLDGCWAERHWEHGIVQRVAVCPGSVYLLLWELDVLLLLLLLLILQPGRAGGSSRVGSRLRRALLQAASHASPARMRASPWRRGIRTCSCSPPLFSSALARFCGGAIEYQRPPLPTPNVHLRAEWRMCNEFVHLPLADVAEAENRNRRFVPRLPKTISVVCADWSKMDPQKVEEGVGVPAPQSWGGQSGVQCRWENLQSGRSAPAGVGATRAGVQCCVVRGGGNLLRLHVEPDSQQLKGRGVRAAAVAPAVPPPFAHCTPAADESASSSPQELLLVGRAPPQFTPSSAHNSQHWTTNGGAPVWNNNNSVTVGARGASGACVGGPEMLAPWHGVVHARGRHAAAAAAARSSRCCCCCCSYLSLLPAGVSSATTNPRHEQGIGCVS